MLRFIRFLPAVWLAIALALLFARWDRGWSGLRICTMIFTIDEKIQDPFRWAVILLLALYPFSLLLGAGISLAWIASRRRARYVGAAALLALCSLSMFYLGALLLGSPLTIAAFTDSFYGSYAALLGCLVVCVAEYRHIG